MTPEGLEENSLDHLVAQNRKQIQRPRAASWAPNWSGAGWVEYKFGLEVLYHSSMHLWSFGFKY